ALVAVAVPAFASGESKAPGVIHAVDFDFVNPETGENDVAINAGETVTFAYPDGGNVHNVEFLTIEPTSCTPALPEFPQPSGWSSVCRFDTPGTYAFVCG